MYVSVVPLIFSLLAVIYPRLTIQQDISVLPFLNLTDNANVFTGVDDATTELKFPVPFYFNGSTYVNGFISSNGLISFGRESADYVPRSFPLYFSDDNSTGPSAAPPTAIRPDIISPYWDDIDLRLEGNIFYESYESDSPDVLKSISNFITNSQNLVKRFECKSAVVVFWSDVCPFSDSNCNDTNSFQVVLASDEDTSYAVFIYKCGLLNWSLHGATIGYDGGEDFYQNYVLPETNNTNNSSNINDIACLNEPISPWSNIVYRLNKVSLSISPPYGHMSGGVMVLVSGPTFNENDTLHCIFGELEVEAVYISGGYASCVSPRLFASTGVTFNITINNVIYENSAGIYYPLPLEETGEATIREDKLLFEEGDFITVDWNPSDILRSVGSVVNTDNIEVDIKLIKFDLSSNTQTEIATLASRIQNSGAATVTLDGLEIPDSEFYRVSLFIGTNKRSIVGPQLRAAGVWSRIFITYAFIDAYFCDQWASTEPTSIGQDILSRVRREFPCSSTEVRIQNDPNFKQDNVLISYFHPAAKNCYRQKDGLEQRTDGYGNQCCYDDQGNLIIGPGSGGTVDKVAPSKSILEHFKEDVVPYLICCVGLFRDCQTYYDRRPSDNGTAYDPILPACWYGDPHIVTLDLHKYTFNGKGEYILIETFDDSFTVQGRMVDATDSFGNPVQSATVFSAIAVKQDESDTVQFELFYEQLIVLVNGERINFDDVFTDQMFKNVTVSKLGNNTLTATFSRGENIKLVEQNGILSVMLLSLPRSYTGKTQGLMGSFDGNVSNDLIPRYQNSPLPLNSTIETIHEKFGITWIIKNASNSLFTYLSGGDWSTYYIPNFTPNFEIGFQDSSLEANATAICGDDLFCRFDIAATGRLDIGASTLQGGLDFQRLVELSIPIICNPPCTNGACVATDTCICSEGYNGILCDILEYSDCQDDNPCQNNGECKFHAGSHNCTCSLQYSGKFCEENIGDSSNISTSNIIIAAVIPGLSLIIAIVVVVLVLAFVIHRKRVL